MINTIEDYSKFLRVILDFGVDYQCVTLPFAMVTEVTIQLACLSHAASVHPEPGSNSQKVFYQVSPGRLFYMDYLHVNLDIKIPKLNTYMKSLNFKSKV